MNRRQFLTATATATAALAASRYSALAADEVKGVTDAKTKLTPPARGGLPVAVLISEPVNVIDLSGPWGVFESVNLPDATEPPFRLFTVAETGEIVPSGSGLKIKPDYTFATAPEVKVIVVPAQKGGPAMIEWLRKTAPATDVTMSVCTGAFKLAKAGLLEGLTATTHHEFYEQMAKDYPAVKLLRGVRFVEHDQVATSGGLTSGTDLALRVVERYFGRPVASATADYMEYHGTGWMV
jgi:transcriptional regulator GlxA family with amidase domain